MRISPQKDISNSYDENERPHRGLVFIGCLCRQMISMIRWGIPDTLGLVSLDTNLRVRMVHRE
jgi:hypothetical protein